MAQLATANQLQKKTTMEKEPKGGAGEERERERETERGGDGREEGN